MLKKIFLILLLLFLAAVAAVAILALAWFKGWSPLWALLGPGIFLGLPLLWALWSFVSAALGRRAFARRVLAKDERERPAVATAFSALRRDWARGINALKAPTRPGGQDPLARLPWFLFLGPPGSGSLRAFRDAGLDGDGAADFGASWAGGEERAQGVDWRILENSVCLEVSGLLPGGEESAPLAAPPEAPEDEPEISIGSAPPGASPLASRETSARPASPALLDPEGELAEFIDLLGKTGRKVPLQGTVLRVPASYLGARGEKELSRLMGEARRVLDAISRELDFTAPLYILLTEFAGAPELAKVLRRIDLSGKPVGVELDPADNSQAALEVVACLREEARDAFIDSLGDSPQAIRPFLTGPWAMEALERPLTVMAEILGRYSHRAAPPPLRGVFLAAPLAEGEGTAPRAEGESPWSLGPASAGATESYSPTLRVLLGKILPENAFLAHRSRLGTRRGQRKYFWGLFFFYLGLLAVACLLTRGVQYQRAVSEATLYLPSASLSASPQDGDGARALARADAIYFSLERLKELQDSFWIKGIGPDPASDYLKRTERAFVAELALVSERLLWALNQQLDSAPDSESMEFAVTLRQLLWLYGASEVGLPGGDDSLSTAEAFPILPKDFGGPSSPLWSLALERLLMAFQENYAHGDWGPALRVWDEAGIRLAISRAMDMSQDLSLVWLVDWAGHLPELSPFSLEDFWRSYDNSLDAEKYLGPEDVRVIPAAYTLAGKEAIDRALARLSAAYYGGQKELVASSAARFWDGYKRDYLDVWRRFVDSFEKSSQGILANSSSEDFQRQRNEGGISPFAKMIQTMADNLGPYTGDDANAPWLLNLELDNDVLRWSSLKSGIVAKADPAEGRAGRLENLGPALRALREQGSNLYYRGDFVEKIYAAEISLSALLSDYSQIVAILNGPGDSALKLAAFHFSGGAVPLNAAPPAASPAAPAPAAPENVGSPFADAAARLKEYAAILYVNPGDPAPDSVQLSARTYIYQALRGLMVRRSAEVLNSYWEKEVFIPTRYLRDDEKPDALYGPGKLVDQFVKNRAGPFLRSLGVAGFAAQEWEGERFPFTDDFLRLVSQGDSANMMAKAPVGGYPVTVSIDATVVDARAAERPERTTLTLRTADKTQTLSNYNYPVSQTFTWVPGTAAAASLEIALPSVSLFISYDGPLSFPAFLNDLISGEFILRPRDFPDHEAQLESLGVSEIRVLMRADGTLPVIQHLNLSASPLPAFIVKAD
ncbi:MAG: hypothetical protein LBO66_04775 [Deltaproteobacteria bacterium]|nr:hypothetical protein [Deltaproteobacteria bacterium]